MKYRKLIALVFIGLVVLSCRKKEDKITPNENNNLNKIMPLGASRVQGNRPTYESYRYELWKDLVDGGWNFDFIGTIDDNASYPEYKSKKFDIDHQGEGGVKSQYILENISEWISESEIPDIVLFSSPGGNDILQSQPYSKAIENINSIIDIIQDKNPDVTIFIEKMAPGKSIMMNEQLTASFEQMKQDIDTIAANKTTNRSKVIAIDMYSGFSDEMLADFVHYNEQGADFIAKKYYEELTEVLKK